MNVAIVGGGPAGLFAGILLKKRDPSHRVTIHERHAPGETYGFGVVLSDTAMASFAAADRPSSKAIGSTLHHWDDIDIHYGGEVLSSTGHGFSGVARSTLLDVLTERAIELGVDLRYESEIESADAVGSADLVLAADGANSGLRNAAPEVYGTTIDQRPNRFVWLGTTRPFPAFTFYFRENDAGLWRIHAYQYNADHSTFIVETTGEALAAAGLEADDEASAVAYCEALFEPELGGHGLIANRSIWRSFPTIRNACWRNGNVVLLGDAAHTAHFSVGSGTRLGMEDAVALVDALDQDGDLPVALARYEENRRPAVESLQRAAQASLQWFEGTERYMESEPIQFAFNLLTRSLRITHEDLRVRDPAFTARVDRWFAERANEQVGEKAPSLVEGRPPPPMFTRFRLRDLVLENRVVVSAMCQYSADDGVLNDWHLVHLGSRAVGGAGLLMTEMTDVSADGRISPGCAGLYRPEHVVAWRRIVDFVHDQPKVAIGLQLSHAGRKGATRLAWHGMDEPLESGGWPLLSASPVPYFSHSAVPREMTGEDMDQVRDEFVRATEMAREAGFDLLELHCAHGYLLASFISPLTNLRTDKHGGSLENRVRYPLEVFDAVRAAWPAEKPISVRISAVDWAPGGQQVDDAVEVARLFAAHGADMIDVSAGQTIPEAKPEYGRQFQTPFSDRIRHEVEIATMAVGNISSYMDVNTILAAGRADLCALARAHLWDPYWIRNAAWRQSWPLPWPGPYASLDGYTPRFE